VSWTWTSYPSDTCCVTATTKNPDYGDVHTRDRRQLRRLSDGNQVWIQDLTVEDRYLRVGWSGLSIEEWSGLHRVLSNAPWMAGRIQADVDGRAPFPVGIAPGMEINCVPLSPGQGYSPGQIVPATKFTLSLFLEQSRLEVEQQRAARGSISLQFRLANFRHLEAGG
jgi:hypothetical protein